MSLRAWIETQAALSKDGPDPDDSEFAADFVAALDSPDDLHGLSADLVDRAIWNISRQLDYFIWNPFADETQKLAVLPALPALLEQLELHGFGDGPGFYYFWSGFTGLANGGTPAIQSALIESMRTQAGTGPLALLSVEHGLAEMHGTPGAAAFAAELLSRSDLSPASRGSLSGLHRELVMMEARMNPPTND